MPTVDIRYEVRNGNDGSLIEVSYGLERAKSVKREVEAGDFDDNPRPAYIDEVEKTITVTRLS